MASGKITVTNNTQNDVWCSITEDGNTNVIVASGTILSKQSNDYPVSGFNLYQVNFSPVTSGVIGATNVPLNGQVVFSVNSDSGKMADE
ncbi:MAG: hypothetical protein WBV94_30870 [Blastocatellia bacterium]